jgi:uncharacterized membrane protein
MVKIASSAAGRAARRSVRFMIAAYRETGYNVMLYLHIVTALVAFAPAFVHPLLANQTRSLDATNRGRVLGMIAGNGRRIYAPALILTGLFGFAMQGMSDGVIEFSQTWFWLAIVVWIVMNGIVHGMLLPAERAVAAGDESVARRVDIAGITLTVLLLFMLYLMVFQPGL